MAAPLHYQIPAEDVTQRQREQAYAELDRLVILLHEHQVLRLACDSTAALADIGRIVTRELDTEEGKQILENLYRLLQAFSRVPPEDLQRTLHAADQALAQMRQGSADESAYPPGVGGVFKLLRDDTLWDALGPALEGLKAFAADLEDNASRDGVTQRRT